MRLLVLLGVLAAACGASDGGAPPTRPTGAGDVVVQVMVAGGFVPVDRAVSAVPTVTVLGDGTVISQAPVIAIYPGPAMTPLQSVRVPSRTVDDLVARASDLGLLAGRLEFGQPNVADAPSTTVTINAGGIIRRHEALALDMGDEPARRALRAFVDATQALPPGDSSWQPPAIAVYDLGAYRPDLNLAQPPLDWPLAVTPVPRCTLLEGADVKVLTAALARANARTPWIVGGMARSLAFRPVVPGQPGC